MLKKGKLLMAIILGIAIISYIETKDFEVMEKLPANIPIGEMEEPVNSEAEDDDTTGIIPELEIVLVETEKIDGHIIEKYQEFEVYKSTDGRVVKKVPTTHYNYIRYQEDF
ncbi:hypothetical protein [Peribacillus glennii]|uniref:Uncharacterized protein n=1 Tax=Peribacillus glennii TaxID=2303991 RepID=A0A372LF92_9BACI|nr:hypothetical protein [Peribacillus glennii]RFU64917.1 hypothetical protein D0466_03080 [Peribacillus glennii]